MTRRPRLHTLIVLALLLGALFGALFHVDPRTLVVEGGGPGEVGRWSVTDWERATLVAGGRSASFSSSQTSALVRTWNDLAAEDRAAAVLTLDFGAGRAARELTGVRELRKERTIATAIKPLGTLFIRLLTMVAVPLVLASLLVGAASLGDVGRVARLGLQAIGYFVLTTAVAIGIGLGVASLLRPGQRLDADARARLMTEFRPVAEAKIAQEAEIDLVEMLVNMVPTNPIQALATGEMLQIVFFAVLMGVVLTLIPAARARPVIGFFEGISDAMIALVRLIMLLAPPAVFALIAATVSEFGFRILGTLAWYTVCVLVGLAIQLLVVYPALLKLFRGGSVRRFFRGLRPAQLVAFSTSSSAATLPVNMECCERNLGVPKQVTSFVLPLGATINMDGTALYQGVAAAFIAQIYGFDLGPAELLTVVLTATLASIGTAPVPGVGLVMLIIVLRAIGVPEEGIALIVGVDRLLDMCRTVLNITGDAACAVILGRGSRARAPSGPEGSGVSRTGAPVESGTPPPSAA